MRPVLGGSRGLGYMKRNSADALPEEAGSHTTLRTSVSLFCGDKAHTLCPAHSSYCPPHRPMLTLPHLTGSFLFLVLTSGVPSIWNAPPTPLTFCKHHLSWLEEPITVTSSERLFPDHLNQHSLSSALLLNLSQSFSYLLYYGSFFPLLLAIFLSSFRVPYEEIKMMILEVDETQLAESMIQVNKQRA